MATIKSYTDLSQSKKLAEIFPLESADMYYQYILPKSDKIKHNPEIGNPVNALKWYNKGYTTSGKEPITLDEYCIPCWSLTALLGIIQKNTPYKMEHFGDKKVKLICVLGDKPWELIIRDFDNEVDACYEMIIHLNELKML